VGINVDLKRRVTPLKTNTKGWRVKQFDADLFRETLDTRPIKDGDAVAKVKEVMQRVTDACDATMPRKKDADRRPPVHWWSEGIADLRKKYHQAQRLAQRVRGKPTFSALEDRFKAEAQKGHQPSEGG